MRHLRQSCPCQLDSATRDGHQAHDRERGGRLAGSGLPDDAEGGTPRNVEADTVNSMQQFAPPEQPLRPRLEVDLQIPDPQQRFPTWVGHFRDWSCNSQHAAE